MFDKEIDALASTLAGAHTKSGWTKIKTVLIGQGDTANTLMATSVTGQPRDIYVRDYNTHELMVVYAPPGVQFSLQDGNAALQGIEMRIGYPPGITRYWLMDAGSQGGVQSMGDLPPLEAQNNSAYWPALNRITNLRARPLDTPTQQVQVDGPFPYIDTSGNLKIMTSTLYVSLASAITALAAGKHQLAIVYFNRATGALGTLTNTAVTAAGTLPSRSEWAYTDVQAMATAWNPNYVPIMVVYLYYNQATIVEADCYRTWDLRPLFGGGGGNITGPNPTTDTAIATWNGTAGNALRNNSAATINSGGDLTANSLSTAPMWSVTISANTIAVAGGWMAVSASSGTTDNLSTISSIPNGKFIVLRAAATHTITVKHGTGNIFLNGGADFALSGDKSLLLFCDGTHWEDVSAGGGSASFATPSIALGSAAAAGAASTVIRSDATIAAFDATSPAASAPGDSAVVGTAAFAARRDHKHAREAWGAAGDIGSLSYGGSAAAGSTGKVADAGHQHPMPAAGATTALNNLASTAVNADILPSADNLRALGSSTLRYSNIWAVNTLNDVNAIPVKNVSGATANANDIGYIQYDSTNGYSYATTTTANLDGVQWCVVIVGAAANATIYVATQGKVTIKLNANCSIGNYLLTSTTAGQASVSTTMRPEVFAVALTANAGGAGGTCTAQLLTGTAFYGLINADYLYANVGSSATAFVSTINGAPTATSVVYGAVTSGAANAIVPYTATALFKARLWNTTRGTSRLITSVNTGTSTITTVSSTDAWASGDALTIESQTVTTALSVKAVDLDGSQQTVIPKLARGIWILCGTADSATVSAIDLHPFETYAVSKLVQFNSQSANRYNYGLAYTKLINQAFDYFQQPSGAGTGSASIVIQGYNVATP